VAEATGNPTSSDPLYARAISLVTKGYFVFPASVVRHPDGTKDLRTVDWKTASTTDLDVVAEWFRDGHGWTDVCIDCGKSGIVVVDLDVRESGDGLDVWREVVDEHGGSVPGTAPTKLLTPSGGKHLYFRNDPREVIGSRNDAWPHVDVKGHGGMVFAYGYVPKPETLPLRPGWLSERVRVVGGVAGIASRPAAGAVGGPWAPDQTPAGSGFILPSRTETRAFTRAQAEAFCSGAWLALEAAPRGAINGRLNVAAATMSHFVPEFWSAQDVESWLVEGQRRAWVAAGGADDGDYGAAISTIRSGLAQASDPWRAVLAADAPATFGGTVGEAEGPVGDELDAAVAALEAKLLDVDGLAQLEPPVPLIEGWLYRDSIARLNGKPGAGKSVLALDFAASVGTGAPWRNIAVDQGDVIYIAAEGASGQLARVNAWAQQHERPVSGVRFLPQPVQVTSPEWLVLVELARRARPALIVVDTQARVTEGMEENSAKEMGLLVGRCEALRAASGACVLLVHHLGHAGEHGRGSSVVYGALFTELTLKRDDEAGPDGTIAHRWVDVAVTKMKDADDSGRLRLEMTTVNLGTDVRGRAVSSVVLTGGDGFLMPEMLGRIRDADLDGNARILDDLFREVFNEGRGGTKAEVFAIVKTRDLMSRATFYRAWNRLLEGGRIARVQGGQSYLWVPDHSDQDSTQSDENRENVTDRS
jgi:hypothetical protein